MTISLQRLLFPIVILTLGTDIAWASVASFDIDRTAYLALGIFAAVVAPEAFSMRVFAQTKN